MKQLGEYYALSRKQLVTAAISGLRRVGKTTLAREFIKNKKAIYFFVYESKTSSELLREFSEELKKHRIITELENISSWNSFFGVVFRRCKNYIIIFDEFQNFSSVDKAVFSIMQRFCDDYKATPLNIIILGSLIGLFKKIFEGKKQPLYGRISAKLKLKPFSLDYSIETLEELKYKNPENLLEIYALFGGFPKYYAALEQFNLLNKGCFTIIEYLFVQENAPLENEVSDILKQKFGRRSSLYYSILRSIATGKNKLNEIANSTHMKENSITRHLSELEGKFSLIRALRPIDNKKNTRYAISHPLIDFWFRFIFDKFSEYSLKDTAQLMSSIKRGFGSYLGKRFEEICKEFLILINEKNKLPVKMDYISNWWGSARIGDVRREIEIDLIALNKTLSSIIFIECKWKDNVDAHEIINELKNKSGYVKWRNNKREEYYCIFAKTFRKRIRERNVLLFDLEDISGKRR